PAIARRKARERAYARQSILPAWILPFGVLVARKRLYMTGVRRGRACGPSLRPGCENGFFSAFERGIEARGLRRGRGLAARDHARAVALYLAGGPPRSQAARRRGDG